MAMTLYRPLRHWTILQPQRILALTLISISIALTCWSNTKSHNDQYITSTTNASAPRQVLYTHISKRPHDPEKWLRENSNINHYETGQEWFNDRPRAAIISLVRNEELEGILQSMRELESRWNKRYSYPWMFFSEAPFTDEFKASTRNATQAPTSYHLIPRDHWMPPSHIDTARFHSSLSYLGILGVGKGYLLSYRNMCRWNSGFFYRHPALSSYDYYWRVEPDVHFFCDIPYDPFRFLRANNLVYGFNMNILDDARSFASLWRQTRAFMDQYPHLVHPDADLSWLVDDTGEYNNCQFFSNFEIGDLNFFRAEPNMKYFEHLDGEDVGGFYYERYGDAPVHTLSVAMFAGREQAWYFGDIGYQHDVTKHCPAKQVEKGLCECEPTEVDENFHKLVPMESPQRKPSDSCLRLWLGREWLEKKEGWDGDVERAMGGDGLGGYVKQRFE